VFDEVMDFFTSRLNIIFLGMGKDYETRISSDKGKCGGLFGG
jgi:hypothetical protein